MQVMQNNVPFHVRNLPIILLLICAVHLFAKTCMLKHQLQHVNENETNTHFALTCVLATFLCFEVSLIIVDIIYQTHTTFRYVIGVNISVVACAFFIVGYMFGHIVEIWFAKMTVFACRQLGIGTNVTDTMTSGEDLETYINEKCDEAVQLDFHNISIDLLIHIVFLPLHIFATAFSFTFAGLFRKRIRESE
ncbi:hypothetical protein CRE_01570 [Caenorhabditis remanei]|uniref:Uncharacterized protein n=1 Tax=Caenorhabditis remanei TaxID=31234 RepID=E3LGI9_CAERE|nr:hypothetical protein CRE_01570 [Caenorhabditis remanei]